ATGGITVNTGSTLAVGAGGTTGSVSGAIANTGTVVFNRSDALSYSGIISGTGSLTKQGAGTLTLTGANTYTGGTLVSTGTLKGDAASLQGAITNNASVTFDQSSVGTYAGDMSGTGSLLKQGASTLTLTGANTHSGGTTVSAGTLSVGDGNTSGSLVGNVVNEANVTFNRSDATTYSGIVSGSGSVTKLGAGTLTLTGANTYTGDTVVSGGTLKGDTSSVQGAITNNASVAFDVATSGTYAGVMSGTGSLVKQGAGTLTLTGANSFSGATTVSTGTLLINGNQTGATGGITVSNGASLGGTGTHGGTVALQANGRLTGTTGSVLTLGALTLNETSRVAVTLSGGSSTQSLFAITGNLTLDGFFDINPGSSFSQGLFRIFEVDGTLTNLGMELGTVPGSPSDYALEVDSLAGTVDFSFTAATKNYWQGGAGIWTADAGSTAWKTFGGDSSGAWVGPEFAVFNATPAGTVAVVDTAGDVRITGMQFATSGYVITGDALTNNAANAEFRVGTGSVGDSAITATIESVIKGTGGLNKTNAGTLVLTGSNTYSGETKVTTGKLVIAGNNTAANGGTTVASGATLAVGNGGTSGSIVGNVTNNGVLSFNRSDALSYAGVVSGSGALVKQGGGTLTLTGANTFTGGTTVEAGTLNLGGGGASGSVAGDLVVNTGATATFDRSDSALVYAGAISGNGALAKQGSGTVTLSGTSLHKGGTTVGAGTLVVTGDHSGATGGITVNTGSTLAVGAGGTTGSVSGAIANTGTVVFNRSDALSYNGIISGTGSLTKQGTGTLTLTGANTYTGATLVSTGTLAVNGDQSAATGPLTVASAGTLTGTGAHGGNVVVQNGGTLRGATGSKFTVGNLTLNAGSIVHVTLGAPSTVELFKVTGNLSLGGQLNVTAGSGIAEGLTRLFSYNGTLSGTLGIGTVDGPASAYSVQTNVANQVNLIYSPSSVTVSWAGGDGTWSSAPDATGWGDSNGKWVSGFALFESDPGTVTIESSSSAPVAITGVQFAVDDYVIDGDTLTTNTVDTTFRVGDGTSAGSAMTAVISATIAGDGGVNKTDMGTLVLSGTNTYAGGTKVSGGVLEVANDEALGDPDGAINLSGGTLRAGADLSSSRSVVVASAGGGLDTGSHEVGLSGIISGSGTLTKAGAGTLILTGDNTLTGGIDITGGTLLVNGDQSEATGAITVGGGGSLGGTGEHAGAVNVAASGRLIGASGSTLTTGAMTLNSSSQIDVTLGAPTDTGLFQVNGNLALNGKLNVTASPLFGEGLYRIFNYTGTLSGAGLTMGNTPEAFPASSFSINTSTSKQVNLVYTQAPLVVDDEFDSSLNADVIKLPSFLILDGTARDLKVDDEAGPVVFTGVQFAKSGYTLSGDALTIQAPDTAIRVGDGTTGGASLVATISAPIAGSETSGIEKTDLGTLVLTGPNTYGGGTRISGGVLQVSTDESLGAGNGSLFLNGGTLRAGADLASSRPVVISSTGSALDTGANDVTLSGVLSGTGGLTKTGSGTLTISGSNTFSGHTLISQGTVALAGAGGSVPSLGSTTIEAGGRLAGTGTIRGNLTNAGTLAPGASPGTITINGDLTQGAGATFAVEIASATSYDKAVVTGTATLGGTLTVSYLDGFVPSSNQSFKILEAEGGIAPGSTFATVVAPSAQTSFMRPFSVTYNPKDVTVGFSQRAFSSLSGPANQRALGAAVDEALLSNSTPVLVEALNAFATPGEVVAALGQLSPQRYERWYDQAVHSATALVRTAEDRMGNARLKTPEDDEELGSLWFEVARREADFDAEGESTAASSDSNGIVVGGDVQFGSTFKVGGLLGYTDENLDLDLAGSHTAIERLTGAAYLRYDSKRVFVEALAGLTYNKHEARRVVAITGAGGVAEGTAEGREVIASLRGGYKLSVGKSVLTPYAALQHTSWNVNDFVESGAGDSSLFLADQKARSLATRVGFTYALPFKASFVTLTPRLDFAWRFEFENDSRKIHGRLGGKDFSVDAKAPSNSGLIGTLGLDATFGSNVTVYARITAETDTAADESVDARAGIDYRF
ncbi:MAG: autotransporter-associated beta strand repeat-containing protein, partial [Opitutaceae bacterium]|nr:autotransporter-associated beta strand repeat-containing protein [Opitutaceae bacterium]